MHEILSSISCTLLLRFASEIPVQAPKFFIPVFPQFGFSSVILFCLHVFNCFYHLITFNCLFIDLINELIHIIFKVLEHIHSFFQVLFLCFSFIAFLRVCSSGVSELYWRYIVLAAFVCVFRTASRHLGLGLCLFYMQISGLVFISFGCPPFLG